MFSSSFGNEFKIYRVGIARPPSPMDPRWSSELIVRRPSLQLASDDELKTLCRVIKVVNNTSSWA